MAVVQRDSVFIWSKMTWTTICTFSLYEQVWYREKNTCFSLVLLSVYYTNVICTYVFNLFSLEEKWLEWHWVVSSFSNLLCSLFHFLHFQHLILDIALKHALFIGLNIYVLYLLLIWHKSQYCDFMLLTFKFLFCKFHLHFPLNYTAGVLKL